MALGREYERQNCALARALEVVGERWTILVLRDLFFGVRRFTDLQAHLDIPRAVLTDRLTRLVDEGVLTRTEYRRGRHEYTLTPHGRELWPTLFALSTWGERHNSPDGPRRIFSHAPCKADLVPSGQCPSCGELPPPEEIDIRPGPGLGRERTDQVSIALREPHRLLTPLRTGA
ncbi:MAG TPA: helix-turn-helix domain-containing protein [Actinophytocola sp.]|nr:helix-turn-helix domain-containing protein [Actinophytocola sp.]